VDHKHHFLNRDGVLAFVKAMDNADLSRSYDFQKHSLYFGREGSEFQLRLPITVKVSNDAMLSDSEVKYLMLLVQTGSASVGVFQGDKCLEHKVFSAYMVRKKQGTSQIKHLKTKGKSRAGSRVRLAKTLLFFEDINTRLIRHFKENEFDRIAFSCSKILMPFLFGSKVETPFDRKDERIYKIPKHLHQPNFEVMLSMQRFLNKGEVIYDQKTFPELGGILDHL